MLVKIKPRTEWGKTPETYGRKIKYSKWRFTKYVSPVCLEDEARPWWSKPLKGKQCWITGSAGDGNRGIVGGLEEARVSMNTPDCDESESEEKLPREVRDTLTCSGQRFRSSSQINDRVLAARTHSAVACKTDSGGPLVCRHNSDSPFYLEGIISYG